MAHAPVEGQPCERTSNNAQGTATHACAKGNRWWTCSRAWELPAGDTRMGAASRRKRCLSITHARLSQPIKPPTCNQMCTNVPQAPPAHVLAADAWAGCHAHRPPPSPTDHCSPSPREQSPHPCINRKPIRRHPRAWRPRCARRRRPQAPPPRAAAAAAPPRPPARPPRCRTRRRTWRGWRPTGR